MLQRDIRRVLAAVKAGEKGLPLAAERARLIAQQVGAELRLATCIYDSHVGYGLARSDSAAGGAQSGMLANEQGNLERIAQSLRDWGADVSTHVVWQPVVHDGLLRHIEEWQPDLVVAGAHRRGRMPHSRLVETDWHLLRDCPRPLLIAKDATFAAYHRVLAAVDPLGDHPETPGLDTQVLAMASVLRQAFDGELVVGHAYPDVAALDLASAVQVAPGRFYDSKSMASMHREAVERLVCESGVRNAVVECHPGDPAAVIAMLIDSKRINLAVLGALKRGALAQLMLGSTAEQVAYDAGCDVLLVKASR
jgi:universal stress protein E